MLSIGGVTQLIYKTMATKSAEEISKVLLEIQRRIPRLLIKNAVSEVKLTPTVEFVVNKALESNTLSKEKKEKLQMLKDSGEFSKMKFKDNIQVQKQINNFVGREINKAIKQGRLPPKSEIPDIDFIKDMYKKMQNEN
jgi:predicted outer membrane protein